MRSDCSPLQRFCNFSAIRAGRPLTVQLPDPSRRGTRLQYATRSILSRRSGVRAGAPPSVSSTDAIGGSRAPRISSMFSPMGTTCSAGAGSARVGRSTTGALRIAAWCGSDGVRQSAVAAPRLARKSPKGSYFATVPLRIPLRPSTRAAVSHARPRGPAKRACSTTKAPLPGPRPDARTPERHRQLAGKAVEHTVTPCRP